MEFEMTSEGAYRIHSIHPYVAELLRQIPLIAQTDTPEVANRFFPSPTHDPEQTALHDDWKAIVQPDLQNHFVESRDIVTADLRTLKQSDDTFSLQIPAHHADAWINAVNQARIILTLQHQFTEDETNTFPVTPLTTKRDLARLQLAAYDQLLFWLLEDAED